MLLKTNTNGLPLVLFVSCLLLRARVNPLLPFTDHNHFHKVTVLPVILIFPFFPLKANLLLSYSSDSTDEKVKSKISPHTPTVLSFTCVFCIYF